MFSMMFIFLHGNEIMTNAKYEMLYMARSAPGAAKWSMNEIEKLWPKCQHQS